MKRKRTRHSQRPLPKFLVIEGTCLGHKVYRGFAPLNRLAEGSRPDIFYQTKNPLGTQRNLNRQHARKAHKYVSTITKAFYPELILNIRDPSYVKFEELHGQDGIKYGTLEFVKHPPLTGELVVSRLDGNHRLWFVDGHEEGMEAIARPASFCFLLLSNLNQELEVFTAINDNQMGMNTSHLQNIQARILGDQLLKVKDPAGYIVQKLQKDITSPFHKKIHEGGAIERGATLAGLTIANLRNAIKDMLTRSTKLSQFADVDVQYQVIKNYWLAVEKWMPDAWKNPADYTLFRGVGIIAVAYLGIEVIDRCLLKGRFESEYMLQYVKELPGKEVFSSKGGIPYAGRAGAKKIANELIGDLAEEGEVSVSKLQKMILGEK